MKNFIEENPITYHKQI